MNDRFGPPDEDLSEDDAEFQAGYQQGRNTDEQPDGRVSLVYVFGWMKGRGERKYAKTQNS